MKKFFTKLGKAFAAHKIIGSLLITIIVIGGYYGIKKVLAGPVVPQYVLSPAHRGSITQTVTGSGQVSAENQLDITSDVSAKITSINVSVGQHVKQGDLIATLDSSDALVSLKNAQIAYAKLTKPAETGDLTSAENNVNKAYSDAFASISNVFIHFPSVMSGLKDLLYSRSGYLSDQQAAQLSQTGSNYRFRAATNYELTNTDYNNLLAIYRLLSKNSPPESIEDMLAKVTDLQTKYVEMLKDVQTAYTFISTSQPDYNPTSATAAGTTISNWSSQAASDLSSLISAKSSIDSANDALTKLNTGAEPLDIESQQLSLDQAQKTYSKYFIRAPFDGVIGRIPASVYGSAGGSTVIATIVGDQKRAVISLNEVDAAKVQAGQDVNITFDAIDGLNATGTVQEVDQVGTVSQGVVSYGVKILINTDDVRIKPGMSVNVTIITSKKDNVLIVPTSAIKTQGGRKYVQVLDVAGMMASSTRRFNTGGQFNGLTISSTLTPRSVTVTVGDSDDTNTEIIDGLTPGQLVITRTLAGSSSSSTAAPSILNSFGNRGAGARTGAGATRTGAAAGNVRFGG